MTTPAGRFRLKSPRRIAELFAAGPRASDARLSVTGLPNDGGVTRLALGVGKRHGNAVHRNRLKRLCRQAHRRVREQLPPGWDLVLIPRPRADHTVDALAASLLAVAVKLDKQRRADP